MPTYRNPTTGEIQIVGNPDLNPDLIAGMELVGGESTTPDTITGDTLADSGEINLPETPTDETGYGGIIAGGGALADFLNNLQAGQPETQTTEDIVAGITATEEATGVTEAQTTASASQQALGLLNAQMAGLVAEAQAVPIQLQEEYVGRGATASGIKPIEIGRLRRIALKSLPLQGQILAQQAIASGDQRALQAAQAKFDQVYDIQREQADREYDYNKEVRGRVWEYMTTMEQRRLDDVQRADDRAYAEKTNNIDALRTLTNQFTQNGQPELAAKIAQLDPTSPTFNQDFAKLQAQADISPQAKLQMQLARMDMQIKQNELDLFDQYGGLTPKEWLALKKQEEEDAKAATDELDTAKYTLRELDSNMAQVDTILNSNALDTVVGTTILSRGTGRQKGKISTVLSVITGAPTLWGAVDELGSADDTVALTQQLLDQGFLDKLIAVKGQGATFGQLSDREGAALKAAASAISQTAIYSGDRVIGYDMSEKEFKKQMGIIKERLSFNKQKWSNVVLSDDDPVIAALDAVYGDGSITFSPSGW